MNYVIHGTNLDFGATFTITAIVLSSCCMVFGNKNIFRVFVSGASAHGFALPMFGNLY